MSIRQSGLWCDLCNKPILDGVYWNIGIKRMNGDNKKGHSCRPCKDKYEKSKLQNASKSEGE